MPRPLCALLILFFATLAHADQNLDLRNFRARGGNITATAISNDGRFLFTGEDYGKVTLWNVQTGAVVQKFDGHAPGYVFATALLPDGKRGVSCGNDDRVIVWDLATGKPLLQMSTGDSIPTVMACSPDGAIAAAGCNDGSIYIWDLADGHLVTTLRHPASLCGIAYSPDEHMLATGYSDGHVILWDAAHWSPKITLPSADQASVGALAFSPDGRLLATGNQNGGGFVWNTADGSQYSSFAGYSHPEVTPAPPVAPVFPGSVITPDNRSAILFLCFNLDGTVLLGSIQDAPARFWDAKSGRFLGTADWFQDNRFYVARFGYTFATAAVDPHRNYIVLMKENTAQVWRLTFTPNPPQQP